MDFNFPHRLQLFNEFVVVMTTQCFGITPQLHAWNVSHWSLQIPPSREIAKESHVQCRTDIEILQYFHFEFFFFHEYISSFTTWHNTIQIVERAGKTLKSYDRRKEDHLE